MRSIVTTLEGIDIFLDDKDGKFYANPTSKIEIKDSTLNGIKKKLAKYQEPIQAIQIDGYEFPKASWVNVILDTTAHRMRYAQSNKLIEKYAGIYKYDEIKLRRLQELHEKYLALKREAQEIVDSLERIRA